MNVHQRFAIDNPLVRAIGPAAGHFWYSNLPGVKVGLTANR